MKPMTWLGWGLCMVMAVLVGSHNATIAQVWIAAGVVVVALGGNQ